MVLAYFEDLFQISYHVYLPMLIIDVLKWPVVALNGVLFASASCIAAPIIILSFLRISDAKIFMLAVIVVFSYVVVQLIVIRLKVYNEYLVLNVLLMIVACILQANVMLVEDVFIGVFLAKLVSSKYQSLADSIRVFASMLGLITAIISGPLLFNYIEIVGTIFICITLVMVALLLARRKKLADPTCII